MQPPPYRIETERLVVRCWEPRDAPLLRDALDTSLEHLRPWMPWAAAQPQDLDTTFEQLRAFRGHFDSGVEFIYGIFDRDEQAVLGGAGLHPRIGAGALEIGYWIRASAVRNGFMSEAAAALTRVAFSVCRVHRVEVRIDPANEASCGVPRKLGFVEEARLRRRLPPVLPGDEWHDALVFALLADEFPAAAASARALTIAAYDVAGRRLALDP